MKLATRIARLRKAYPKVSRFGQMYKPGKPSPTAQTFRKVTLWTMFVSVENTHMIRDHIFESKTAKTPEQWHRWFSEHLAQIHMGDNTKSGAILSGLELRTAKQWSVKRIIGWSGNDKHRARNSIRRKRGNKAKSKRAPHG